MIVASLLAWDAIYSVDSINVFFQKTWCIQIQKVSFIVQAFL